MSLATYDLTLVFRCAVELAEATTSYRPEEHADILAKSPPHRMQEDPDAVWRWHDALDAIVLASNRLKRVLGANGPLDAADSLRDPSAPTWEEFRSNFKYSAHPPAVRQALRKLAAAAIDLSGYAGVQVPEPLLRERGMRLLRQGLAQLWGGITTSQQAEVRALLPRTRTALGWPGEATEEPSGYDGPEEIAAADQYRVIDTAGGFAARNPDWLNEQQRLWSVGLPCSPPQDDGGSATAGAVGVDPHLSPSFYPPSPPDPPDACAQEVERLDHLHRLATRCVNVLLRLHFLRHCFDGERRGREALVELCDVVRDSPSLPLTEDPFCREEVVEVAGITATSAHVAALALAQRTWDAVQLTSLGEATRSRQREGEGATYTRTSFAVIRRSPTEIPWCGAVWQEVCEGLDNDPAPDADWFQAALALERTLASRRLDQRFAAGGDVAQLAGAVLVGIDPASHTGQQRTNDPPRPEPTAQKKEKKAVRDRKLEARDKWIYQQCCARIAYKEIRTRLKARCQDKGWSMIDSIQGIRAAAVKYAQRHHKPLPPSRQNL